MLSQLGEYRLVRHLATGGMAQVYVGIKPCAHGIESRIAVKHLLPRHARDQEFRDLFSDEARLACRLTHPHIVKGLDFQDLGPDMFLVLEYVEGVDLKTLLALLAQRAQKIPLSMALHLCYEISDALVYAHNLVDAKGKTQGVVHRDISPANIFIGLHGIPKLGDFGIAKLPDAISRTDNTHVRGKLGYMSPEQVRGDTLDGRSDVFCLCIILFEMLSGHHLFAREGLRDLAVLLAIGDGDLSRLYEHRLSIPKDVFDLLQSGLSSQVDTRPGSVTLRKRLFELWRKHSRHETRHLLASLIQECITAQR